MNLLKNLSTRLSFCAKIGAFAGPFVGGGVAIVLNDYPTLSPLSLFSVSALLTLFAWLGILLFVGMILRYGVRQIWAITLITCLLTGACVSFLVYAFNVVVFSMLLGFIVGILSGEIVCKLCEFIYPRLGGNQ